MLKGILFHLYRCAGFQVHGLLKKKEETEVSPLSYQVVLKDKIILENTKVFLRLLLVVLFLHQ